MCPGGADNCPAGRSASARPAGSDAPGSYVLEGTWEYTVEGKPPMILKAGEVLFIPTGAIHSATNVGSSRAAELATYMVEKEKPLVTVVK